MNLVRAARRIDRQAVTAAPAPARHFSSLIAAIAVVATTALSIGCRGADTRASDSLAPSGRAAAATADSPAKQDSAAPVGAAGDSAARVKAACVSEGTWQTCSVEKRLTDAGFVPQKQSVPAANLFPVKGAEYALGPARLHVYLFPSAQERAAAVAGIDTVAITRPGTPAQWSGPAWLITSNNLVAVLVSDNGRLVERVQLALTAGLPSAAH